MVQIKMHGKERSIVDSRFFRGQDYIIKAMEDNDVDAVIVLQGTFLLGNELMYRE